MRAALERILNEATFYSVGTAWKSLERIRAIAQQALEKERPATRTGQVSGGKTSKDIDGNEPNPPKRKLQQKKRRIVR